MTNFLRNLKLLMPLAVIVLIASSADAGFVSVDSDASLLFSADSMVGSDTAGTPAEQPAKEEVPPYLKHLSLEQLQFGHSPTSGGMGTSPIVSSGGSSAPAAILHQAFLPTAGPVSPLYLREIPFTPQQLIAEIFRPPCA